jgi:hypothetical protein
MTGNMDDEATYPFGNGPSSNEEEITKSVLSFYHSHCYLGQPHHFADEKRSHRSEIIEGK